LLVGELHAVAVFESAQIKESPLAGEALLVKGLIKANEGRLLLQLLDAESLFGILFGILFRSCKQADCVPPKARPTLDMDTEPARPEARLSLSMA
jgi:hypothetical protein